MKKIIITLWLAVFMLSSCVNNRTSNDAIGNDTCHIERYFHSFMSRFPNGLNNDILKEEMNKKFISEISDSLSNSYWLLEDYPLRFENIQQGKNGLCRVHFQSWIMPDGFSFKDYAFHQFALDIVGEVPTSYIDILKEDEYYIIHGKLKRFLKHSEFASYTDECAYTPTVGIEREIGSSTDVNWQLGEMLFSIDTIYVYTPKI